jgi:hypothetical protein
VSNPVTFTTSATVQATDGTYLTRTADEELFQLCHQGEYAYILTSRQMGKSSLMVATAERLQGEGIQTAIVDLQRLGAQTTNAKSWYLGVLTVLARKLRIFPQLMIWWEENSGLGAAQRFSQFIEDLVLPLVETRLVVFIDEIDSTLSLDFTDDFFIALRYCFTARAENPNFKRLSFVLIGVATPGELIKDRNRTPFNIGTPVELRDFDETEAMPLASGLGLPEAEARLVLTWVLAWTGGHPYLTQRVCQEIVQQPMQKWSTKAIEALIEELFLGDKWEKDTNLQFVRDLILSRAPQGNALGVLRTYRNIRLEDEPVYDEAQSLLKAHLKLSGLVKLTDKQLILRNQIYREVFDHLWIEKHWPQAELNVKKAQNTPLNIHINIHESATQKELQLQQHRVNQRIQFTAGGTVQAQDGTYLPRQADEDLLKLCARGEYAYILTARQMGKSSLMIATAERLQAEGIQTAIVDLQRFGATTITLDEWYLGILSVLARRLRLPSQLILFWEANLHLSAAQRMVQFFEEVVLPQIEVRLVVFIDEIDSTLSLDFTDDFFVALRYCFTARAENPAFSRLSFVLIGVATPSELIRDPKRTPFNIGYLVELQDFTEEEAMPLAAGLGLPVEEAQQLLRWVLVWTGGHPYLTQRVCEEIAQQPRQTWDENMVAVLINQLFFGEQREQDNNLKFVQNMLLTGRYPHENSTKILETYREIWQVRQTVYDEEQSILKAHLKLSGVVKRAGPVLAVRNPIYYEVFNDQWIRKHWPETWWQPLKPAMPLIAGLMTAALGLGTLSVYALEQRNEALAQARRAEDALAEAAVERQNALDAQAEAERALEALQATQDMLSEAEAARAEAEAALEDLTLHRRVSGTSR